MDSNQLPLSKNMHDNNIAPLKKKKTRFSSTTNVDVIPHTVILNILKKLPVKSLLRFRCVCKSWRCIIDDPSFIDMHRIQSHHRRGGVKLLASQYGKITLRDGVTYDREFLLLVDAKGNWMPLPTPINDNPLMIRRSNGYCQAGVEGLICLDNMIWNPTIRKRFDLPPQCVKMSIIRRGSNRAKIENAHYLGFDSSTKQYKVLSICVGCPEESSLRMKYSTHSKRIEFLQGMFQMQVITLEGAKSSWRDITHHIPGEAIKDMTLMWFPTNPNLYLKDEIYIMVGYPQHLALMVFSVGQERFRFIRLPEEITHAQVNIWNMTEVRECVALMKMNGLVVADASGTEIWRLISTNCDNAPATKGVGKNHLYNLANISIPSRNLQSRIRTRTYCALCY
ncbi:OLC1v1017766C1 [Oldenlandia corymbosa var. corymbosa]|uniref:OLC1v1017766C1 n=1 Tax=Oldenlandia corymbosa var. corymbosa TaxID=529605 RepID=A0AAV1EA49_OLDCO|nr:OLC1v1017766C1 [Oldenlandia corymbosa var. corymbosa]